MRTRETTYRVRHNDTLWGIAKAQYGDGGVWPELARHNELVNPSFLFVGQILELPSLGATKAPAPEPLGNPWRPRPVAYPGFSYNLDKLPKVVVDHGAYRITIAMTGSVTLQRRGTIEAFKIADLKKIENTWKQETDSKFLKIASDVKYVFDPTKRTFEFTAGLAATVKGPNGQTLTYKVSVGVNELKFSCEPTPVKGTFGEFDLEGKMGWEVKVEGRLPQPAYETVQVPGWQHELQRLRDWLPSPRDLMPSREQLVRGTATFMVLALLAFAVLAAIKLAPALLVVAFIAVVLFAATGRSPST